MEMPGLCLTESQASRLWNLDPQTTGLALEMLVAAGSLARTEDGRFIATSMPVRNGWTDGITVD